MPHLPLWEIRGHETSRAAAALSEMAAEQGRFWPCVNAVHASRRQLSRAGYLELMENVGVQSHDAEARLSNPEDAAAMPVLRDENLAERLGVTATPTFILLVAGQEPISANQRTLPRLLNSAVVQSQLAVALNAPSEKPHFLEGTAKVRPHETISGKWTMPVRPELGLSRSNAARTAPVPLQSHPQQKLAAASGSANVTVESKAPLYEK